MRSIYQVGPSKHPPWSHRAPGPHLKQATQTLQQATQASGLQALYWGAAIQLRTSERQRQRISSELKHQRQGPRGQQPLPTLAFTERELERHPQAQWPPGPEQGLAAEDAPSMSGEQEGLPSGQLASKAEALRQPWAPQSFAASHLETPFGSERLIIKAWKITKWH